MGLKFLFHVDNQFGQDTFLNGPVVQSIIFVLYKLHIGWVKFWIFQLISMDVFVFSNANAMLIFMITMAFEKMLASLKVSP